MGESFTLSKGSPSLFHTLVPSLQALAVVEKGLGGDGAASWVCPFSILWFPQIRPAVRHLSSQSVVLAAPGLHTGSMSVQENILPHQLWPWISSQKDLAKSALSGAPGGKKRNGPPLNRGGTRVESELRGRRPWGRMPITVVTCVTHRPDQSL